MITIARRNTPRAVYIGRPTPLGNPFVMNDESERDDVCDAYERWFNEQLASNASHAPFTLALRHLETLAAHGDLILGCYCAPKRCHGDTIKAYLERKLNE